MSMKCELNRKVWKYTGEDFSFKLIDEKLHTYSSLILKPLHIKIITNESSRSTKELKQYIIDMFFFEENERVRLHNNEVARKRREKRKNVA